MKGTLVYLNKLKKDYGDKLYVIPSSEKLLETESQKERKELAKESVKEFMVPSLKPVDLTVLIMDYKFCLSAEFDKYFTALMYLTNNTPAILLITNCEDNNDLGIKISKLTHKYEYNKLYKGKKIGKFTCHITDDEEDYKNLFGKILKCYPNDCFARITCAEDDHTELNVSLKEFEENGLFPKTDKFVLTLDVKGITVDDFRKSFEFIYNLITKYKEVVLILTNFNNLDTRYSEVMKNTMIKNEELLRSYNNHKLSKFYDCIPLEVLSIYNDTCKVNTSYESKFESYRGLSIYVSAPGHKEKFSIELGADEYGIVYEGDYGCQEEYKEIPFEEGINLLEKYRNTMLIVCDLERSLEHNDIASVVGIEIAENTDKLSKWKLAKAKKVLRDISENDGQAGEDYIDEWTQAKSFHECQSAAEECLKRIK